MTTTRTKKQQQLPVIRVKRLHPNVIYPDKQTAGAACYDLICPETVHIHPHQGDDRCYKIPTGLAFEIPPGYHLKVFLRSSIGLQTKLRLANGTGIIDSDYRGEVCLLLENIGKHVITINEGDRICQCLLEKNVSCVWQAVDELSETDRGTGGLGSTGKGTKDA